jgi:hypothetical protein
MGVASKDHDQIKDLFQNVRKILDTTVKNVVEFRAG